VLTVQGDEIELPSVLPKANILNRFIAKFLDLLIVSAIAQIPLDVSFLAALSYILIADGFAGGRSPGKQMIGLRVVTPETAQGITFKESIIRNISLGLAYLLFQIPYVGWLLGISLVGFESLLLIGNVKGCRAGDELAKTQVLDYTISESYEK